MQIQYAKKEHADMISKLIYSTEVDPEIIWGFGTKEEILSRLTNLVKRKDTRYSYQYAKVAIREGKVCGAMVALPHKELEDLNSQTDKVILKSQQGIWTKFKWLFTALKSMSLEESKPGEYYVANIATFQWARGKGIATKLLKDAEEMAKDQGLSKCSLLVDQSKPAVIKLYSQLGYEIESEEELEEQKYYRMIKLLE